MFRVFSVFNQEHPPIARLGLYHRISKANRSPKKRVAIATLISLFELTCWYLVFYEAGQ